MEEQEEDTLAAYDLFEQLIISDDPKEKSLGELLNTQGGAGLLEVNGSASVSEAHAVSLKKLQRSMGNLLPEQIKFAHDAGMGDTLLKECTIPREMVASLAAAGRIQEALQYLEDVFNNCSLQDIGSCIDYLRNFDHPQIQEAISDYRDRAVSQCQYLWEHAELLYGLNEWIYPPTEMTKRSAEYNPSRSLIAADIFRSKFDVIMHDTVFSFWIDSLDEIPHFSELIQVSVPCARWEEAIDEAYNNFLIEIDEKITDGDRHQITEQLDKTVDTAVYMSKKGNVFLSNLCGIMATDVLCLLDDATVFLEYLDTFLARAIFPVNIDRLVEAGLRIGIDPNEIYDRMGDATEVLKKMIESNHRDSERYKALVEKIKSLSHGLSSALAQICFDTDNKEGMAALLAFDLNLVEMFDGDWGLDCIGFKGIGGGTNLLKQWFDCNQGFNSTLRARIKDQARAALLELSLNFKGKDGETAEQGIIPQTRIRPYRSSDDLDLLDIENTLDHLIGCGKNISEIVPDDFYVYDTAKGAAAFGVLIDVSGSMEGKELAMCAISVVMLLSKLKSREVAVALFESDTHVIKGFLEDKDLSEVADQLLDLQAMGGTCIDEALRWIGDEFEKIQESEFRVLFVLSDYELFEEKDVLQNHASRLGDLQISFMGAAHSHYDKRTLDIFLNAMNSDFVKVKTIEELPQILTDTVNNLGEMIN